jgi:hypothetical protein
LPRLSATARGSRNRGRKRTLSPTAERVPA